MREPLTHVDVLDLETTYDDATPEELLELAERLFDLAEDPHADDQMPQSTLHALAGQYFRDAGELTKAEDALSLAAEEPLRRNVIDPRCFLVDVYLAQDRLDAATELDTVLRKSRMQALSAYAVLGEVWQEHHQLRALGWFNRGIELAERTDQQDEGSFALLLGGRRSLRRAMGHEPDEYDEIAREAFKSAPSSAD